MITAPEGFDDFSLQFDDAVAEDYDTDEEFVAISARNASALNPGANETFRAFITHLLEGGYSDDELEAFWESTLSHSAFAGWHLRQLLPIIRDNIGLPIPRKYFEG